MTKAEVSRAIEGQITRIVYNLDTYDPSDLSYHTALRSIEYLMAVEGELLDALEFREQEAPAVVADVPYEEPEMPHTESPKVVQMPTPDRVALRKRLATAQKNGINVAKIVSELGATGFTKLPDEKLPALDEALKELGY